MVRPRRCRLVRNAPDVTHFKPQGVKLRKLDKIDLNVEEFEAVRLKDYKKLDQQSAAAKMKVSQPTFHRIYADARAKIATALVEGLAIKIQGGMYKMPGRDQTGPTGQGPMTGRGMGPCGTRARWRCRLGQREGWSKEEEKRWLEQHKQDIDQRLNELKDRE